jgi:hypothetical protein
MRRRRRLPTSGVAGSGLLAAVLLFSGCGGDDSSSPAAVPTTGTTDPAASHTPADLRHPCAVLPARVAVRVLGRRVTARRVPHPANVRRLECRYGPSLDIVSAPDVRSIGTIVGLYVGVDRLAHHPVEVPGADDAVVILNSGDRPSVTLFAQQGFVVHTVVVHAADPGRAERVAVRLAGLVVAGNPPG